jgi:hypothetical protein
VPSPDFVFIRLAKSDRGRTDRRTTYFFSAPLSLSYLPARLTQEGIEVLERATAANARLTQEGIEVLERSVTASGRLTQDGIEVLQPVGGYIPDRPANDQFANPDVLAGNGDCAQTTNWNEAQPLPYGGATSEGIYDPLSGSFHHYGIGTVWYSWTAPANGYLTILTNAPTSGTPIGDTVVGIYTGSTLPTLVEIDYNDDYHGDPYAKLYDVPVTSGTVYHIEVTGFSDSDFGAFELCWSFSEVLVHHGIYSFADVVLPQ